MAIVTLIAPMEDDDFSNALEVGPGDTFIVGLFSSEYWTERVGALIYIGVPGGGYIELKDEKGRLVVLTRARPFYSITGAGTYYVEKPATSGEIGVFYDNGQFGE